MYMDIIPACFVSGIFTVHVFYSRRSGGETNDSGTFGIWVNCVFMILLCTNMLWHHAIATEKYTSVYGIHFSRKYNASRTLTVLWMKRWTARSEQMKNEAKTQKFLKLVLLARWVTFNPEPKRKYVIIIWCYHGIYPRGNQEAFGTESSEKRTFHKINMGERTQRSVQNILPCLINTTNQCGRLYSNFAARICTNICSSICESIWNCIKATTYLTPGIRAAM